MCTRKTSSFRLPEPLQKNWPQVSSSAHASLMSDGTRSSSPLAAEERRALAVMDHPHIAKVLGAGASPDGRPYFVMDFVEGEPITAYCDANSLPIAARVELFIKVCRAVEHAHQKGIIHRDLKPSNILVGEQDGKAVPKVIDFGVAKANTNQDKTETGMLKGKLPYMSPEQLWQSELDCRSDVFTLGVVLWELLSGERLFAREAEVATINAVLNSTLPTLKGTRTDVPEALVDVALRTLEKDLKITFAKLPKQASGYPLWRFKVETRIITCGLDQSKTKKSITFLK